MNFDTSSMNELIPTEEEVKQFRDSIRIVKGQKKIKMINSVFLCLNFTRKYPCTIPLVGAFWIGTNSFLINSRIFGQFTGRKPNSINRNFREHNFCQKKLSYIEREEIKRQIPSAQMFDLSGWIKRWANNFSVLTTEQETIAWTHCPSKKQKTTATIPCKVSNTNENPPQETKPTPNVQAPEPSGFVCNFDIPGLNFNDIFFEKMDESICFDFYN